MNKLRLTLIACLWIGGGNFYGFAQTKSTPAKFGSELFPMPQEIAVNVEFWRKIYADYPTTNVLIHDTEDLGIIYEVVELKGLSDSISPSSSFYRQEWKKVEGIRDEYRSILSRLANRQLDLSNLTLREKRVVEIFGASADPDVLRRAAGTIRAQQGLKDRFHLGLQRSGLYRDFIAGIFSQYGLPEELIMLPHVESSFNYQAYSKVGAAGIWQFMRSTGRLFLTINYDVDERLDPIRSTEAAAKLLQLNYNELGAWPLAITAYNHGLNGMRRAKAMYGTDFGRIYREYQSRTFGFASRNFYAEFLAALHVATNHENYFGDVQFHRPVEFVEITTDHYLTVNSILEAYKIDLEELRKLNPALRPPVLRSQRRIPRGYTLRLPKRPDIEAGALLARIDPSLKYEEQVQSEWYRVKRGDNLTAIAQKHNVPVTTLAEYNNLNRNGRLTIGQILRIPPKGIDMLASTSPVTTGTRLPVVDSSPIAPASSAAVAVTTPEPTVVSDAGTSEAEVTSVNRIEREAIVTLDLPAASKPALITDGSNVVGGSGDVAGPQPAPTSKLRQAEPLSQWIHVEADETLGHYASWLEIPTQRLRELNGLRYNQDIQIGQRIRLSYERVSAEEFQRRRYEYQRSLEEDFFSNYAVDTLQTHRVGRGQNVWQICNDIYQVPIWLVAKYNPDRDLAKLHTGDSLAIPVVVPLNPATTPSQQ
ncbi:MAG: transglycosylase SLT domain-containing protein [candidate division KSB1 bacterium]|nr:transglycosylase SLT domain-containing protein [candidate division KSB1 bacterium]MDZ7301249.1 transglycosylase SLT domain-containing protein [candidate division KSB1 bacterium]MDZ7310527.1 transglycosylase SLT domain-containing protein [candidate division KSB1 bacterium]